MSRWSFIVLCVALCIIEVCADEPINIRAKRQQCRCVRNPVGSGLTCSCAKPQASPSTMAQAGQQQQSDLAQELQQTQYPTNPQARCACLQIVFQGNPQYQCHCGDQNGNTLPSTTTVGPSVIDTTTTPAPTTTTTTTTAAPITTTTQQYVPTVTQGGQGQCQCIMIRISGPASAHYQCNCQNTQTPGPEVTTIPSITLPPIIATTTTPAPTLPPITVAPLETTTAAIYPPVGTINSTEQGCFCVDQYTQTIQPQCGCQCNCLTMLVTVPTGVCACPQDSYGQPMMTPAQAPPAAVQQAPVYTQVPTQQTQQTLPPTTAVQYNQVFTTAAPVAPVAQPVMTAVPQQPQQTSDTQYPLTTTCVMYVGVQAQQCNCLPQYDQCAQNICCLKAKYRSHKKVDMGTQPVQLMDHSQEPSTIDMLMNVLQKIKTKLSH